MLDKSAFTETLRLVAEIGRTSDKPLSKEEIVKYFGDMELTEEQAEMIYQYLLLPPEVRTAEPEPEEEPESVIERAEEEDSYFQLYLDELSEIEELSPGEMDAAYERLLAGDASVIDVISGSWLGTIAELAVPYGEQGEDLEDVIQEGNMALLIKLSQLVGAGKVSKIDRILETAVTEAMTAYTEAEKSMQGPGKIEKEKQEKKEND